ncbi:unnamed protein product [Prunus armeniaca]
MTDLLYRFKRYNPGKKLNLSFIADPPPLPEGMTEEMIEDYEGEDAPEDAPADAEEATAEADEAAAETEEAAASMDMWLCVKRAINAAEKAKKAYEDDRARVAEAGKAIQAHSNLAKDLQAAER